MDRSNIPNTSKWRKEIQKGIYSSQLVIILVSQASMTSDNVDQEIDFAVDQTKPLLQIDIEPLEAGTFRHLALTGLHRLSVSDFSQTFDFTDLVNQVKNSVPVLKAEAPNKIVSSTSEEKSQVQAKQIASKFPRSSSTKEKPPSKPIPMAVDDINVPDKGSLTKLHQAISKNQLEEVISLVERGADINAQGDSNRTPLHLAVENVALVRWLLLQGADYNAKTVDGSTPLDFARNAKSTQTVHLLQTWAAVKEGYTTANKALRAALDLSTYKAKRIFDAVAAGADDMTMRDGRGLTALHWAAQENHLNIVLLLLERGADTTAKDNQGNTPLDLAKEKGATKVIDRLSTSAKVATPKEKSPIPESQKVPLSNSDANEQLRLAFLMGKNPTKSKKILEAICGGVTDFSLTDPNGLTALHWAARKNDVEAARIALDGNADPKAINDAQQTPLDLAIACKSTGVVALLSAPLAIVDPSSEPTKVTQQTIVITQLTEAEANKNLKAALNSPKTNKAKFILQAIRDGATNLAVADKLGRTPLHWAAAKNDVEVIKLILSKRVKVDAETYSQHETPLCFAAKNNSCEAARILIEHGADVNHSYDIFPTPLSCAAEGDHVEVAQVLIDHGADVRAVGSYKMTLRSIATYRKSHRFLKFLKEVDPR